MFIPTPNGYINSSEITRWKIAPVKKLNEKRQNAYMDQPGLYAEIGSSEGRTIIDRPNFIEETGEYEILFELKSSGRFLSWGKYKSIRAAEEHLNTLVEQTTSPSMKKTKLGKMPGLVDREHVKLEALKEGLINESEADV